MASITIPDVDDKLKASLEARAAQRGRSLEAEARDILREALNAQKPGQTPENLYAAIRSVVEPLGGIQFDLPVRQPVREPPRFE
ncbi:MAG: plasmid stabilization protein [Alphaproteobacteria bacterium]